MDNEELEQGRNTAPAEETVEQEVITAVEETEGVAEETVAENTPEEQDTKKIEKRKNRRHFVIGLLVGMVIMAGALAGAVIGLPVLKYWISPALSSSVLDETTTKKINLITEMIQEDYYEDVDDDTLREGLYRGLFDNLDEYSQYYSAEEYEDMYSQTVSGQYCGIGATLQKDQDTNEVLVKAVTAGSPAEEAGLQVGDKILTADDYVATEMDLSDFVSHVKGEEGTTVRLAIERDGERMELDIERKNLDIQTVSYQMIGVNIGYIQVSEFTNSTTSQFEDALADLQSQGMASLIIDLRSNPGGLLKSATTMLDDILPKGLLVYTEDKEGNRENYYSTDDESLDIPIAILIDENSASASEIFAGAMKDREAATIIGTTSYGKGVVQSIMPLSDGSAVKLTTYKYFTPNGVCIQGTGIEPDIELEFEFLGDEDETYSVDLDNQIQKAVEVLQGEE